MIKRLLLSAACAIAMMTHVHAAQAPRPGSLDSRVTSVVYQSNNVVKVSATYGISTMIIFDEDEKFETISLGDTDSWQVAPSEKGNILFVKPIAKNVATNMNVVTSKRIYFLELNDHAPSDGKQVFGIRFVYPEKDLNVALRNEAEYRAANPNMSDLDKANVNIDYSFSGDPALKPLVIFDDGKKTFSSSAAGSRRSLPSGRLFRNAAQFQKGGRIHRRRWCRDAIHAARGQSMDLHL